MSLEYVNYLGNQVGTERAQSAPRRKLPKSETFHKGWRVVGLPPGSLEDAQKKHANKQARSKAAEKQPFDVSAWLCSAQKKSVRAKPYEIRESADVCASLAEKAGWAGVQVREIKQE